MEAAVGMGHTFPPESWGPLGGSDCHPNLTSRLTPPWPWLKALCHLAVELSLGLDLPGAPQEVGCMSASPSGATPCAVGGGWGETCVLPSQVRHATLMRACSYIKIGACTGTPTRLQHVGNMHNTGSKGVPGPAWWAPYSPRSVQLHSTPHLWERISHQTASPVFAGHARLTATAEKGGRLPRSCRLN